MVAYSFKRQFIVPICLGLGLPYELDDIVNVNAKPKLQTIRANGKRRHARPGETLQLYFGQRTKQCRKIGEARCTEVLPIEIRPVLMAVRIAKRLLPIEAVKALALADGFASVEDMKLFWQREHSDVERFEGALIRWEPKG